MFLWSGLQDIFSYIGWFGGGIMGQSPPTNPGSPGSPGTGDITKLLDGLDVAGAKTVVSGVMRSLGFGPESDNIATFVVGLFVVLVIIGYAAGPLQGTGNTPDTSKSTDKKDKA